MAAILLYLYLQQESSRGVSSKATPGCRVPLKGWGLKGHLNRSEEGLSACSVKPPTPCLRMANNRGAFGAVCKPDKGSAVFHLDKQLFYSCLFCFFPRLPNCGTFVSEETPQVNSTVTICCGWFVPCCLCLKRNTNHSFVYFSPAKSAIAERTNWCQSLHILLLLEIRKVSDSINMGTKAYVNVDILKIYLNLVNSLV